MGKEAAAAKTPPATRGREPFKDSGEKKPPEEKIVMDSDKAEEEPPAKLTLVTRRTAKIRRAQPL